MSAIGAIFMGNGVGAIFIWKRNNTMDGLPIGQWDIGELPRVGSDSEDEAEAPVHLGRGLVAAGF